MATLLLSHPDIDPNVTLDTVDSLNGSTCLHLICSRRNYETGNLDEDKLLGILLDHKATNVNAKNELGRTALMLAVDAGNMAAVQARKSISLDLEIKLRI